MPVTLADDRGRLSDGLHYIFLLALLTWFG
jgi:hypothetical protein